MQFKRIGEVSEETKLTIPQLRYLQRIGLIRPSSTGEHRRYTRADVERIGQIQALVKRGYRPSQILAILVASGALSRRRPASENTIYESVLRGAREGRTTKIQVSTPRDYNTTYKLLRRIASREHLDDVRLKKVGTTLEVTARRTKSTRALTKPRGRPGQSPKVREKKPRK